MLKLPKGLKKKKKGKKSKKDQELFTEEELEQYRREHQAQASSALNSAAPSDSEDHPGEKSENDEEWSKFAALTTGIDSVLKKTQVDLDRIKESSFFQKVPTKVELEAKEKEERLKERQQQQEEHEQQKAAEELINAVVELSESEPNSEAEEDIFDTDYIDAIASGELPIAFVPESPVLESFEGPDPFDTSYAEKIIKGPEVSKRGKKIVNIGAAVEVLTGRVENVSSRASIRRPRRGPANLLLESFDEGLPDGEEAKPVVQETNQQPLLTLLDDSTELSGDVPIDLSVSLHLAFQKEKDDKKEDQEPEPESQLNFDEFDDLCKRQPAVEGDNFELLVGEVEPEVSKKPARPPPPRPATGPRIVPNVDEEFALEADDPFDTGFVERVLPATAKEDDDFDPRAESNFNQEEDDDFNFDPRAEEDSSVVPTRVKTPDLFSAEEHSTLQVASLPAKDLLSGSCADLTNISQTPLEVAAVEGESEDFVDPFDTSAVNLIVAPGKTELKFLEKEFLSDGLKHSLSDPDFDPRAESEPEPKEQDDFDSIVQRKSSLSLHINTATAKSKTVLFAVPTPDLLKIDGDHSVTKKPLTPYYSRESSLPESDTVDPFDTTFVPSIVPSQLELNLIEKELNNTVSIKHSLSDQDFDPRADSAAEEPKPAPPKSDLLGTDDNFNQKVLTPAQELEPEDIDPFDTSIAINIQPGRAELRLLENEFNSEVPTVVGSQDFLSGSQDSDPFFVKVLTPQLNNSTEEADIDPFDTSFAIDLGPGRTEIKLLESELIDRKH